MVYPVLRLPALLVESLVVAPLERSFAGWLPCAGAPSMSLSQSVDRFWCQTCILQADGNTARPLRRDACGHCAVSHSVALSQRRPPERAALIQLRVNDRWRIARLQRFCADMSHIFLIRVVPFALRSPDACNHSAVRIATILPYRQSVFRKRLIRLVACSRRYLRQRLRCTHAQKIQISPRHSLNHSFFTTFTGFPRERQLTKRMYEQFAENVPLILNTGPETNLHRCFAPHIITKFLA